MCDKPGTPMVLDKDFELYKIAINDEQYYRQMFHARLSYHTNILVALLTAIGAGYLQARAWHHFFVIALFSLLYVFIARQSTSALQRMYEHFIEMLRFREEMEVRLGLRTLDSIGEPDLKDTQGLALSPRFWTAGPFFKRAWTQSRPAIGYFAQMQTILGVFIAVGLLSAVVAFIAGLAAIAASVVI